MTRHRWSALLVACAASWARGVGCVSGPPVAASTPPPVAAIPAPGVPAAGLRTGFTFHFDFLADAAEADRLLEQAFAHGARILNVVPPPRIWDDPVSLAILRRVFAQARAHSAVVMLNRIDGSAPVPPGSNRINRLYTDILTERGRLPSGVPTSDLFLATVGKPDYERWLAEETRFYAETFGGEDALGEFSVGPFNEPFVSQRGALLAFDESTNSYELAQYTPYLARLWHERLGRSPGGIAAVNARYGTSFATVEDVPMPRSESDPRFPHADLAYWDLVATVNDWVVGEYEQLRALWHAHARPGVPFVLQLSGFAAEKLEKGRPAFAALDIFDWIRRADALGLSLYTNCEYPDWGHGSVAATVRFANLARLLGKPVFVLETGSECGGAVANEHELDFLSGQIAMLRPSCLIYEFLRTTYCETFNDQSGKLLDGSWRPSESGWRAVERMFRVAAARQENRAPDYVLDDITRLEGAPACQAERLALIRAALAGAPLVFVPPDAVPAIPDGSTIALVCPASVQPPLAPRLKVISAQELLARIGQSAPPAPR